MSDKKSIEIVNNFIYEIEKKYDLLNKKINNTFFWEKIRISVQSIILRKLSLIEKPHYKAKEKPFDRLIINFKGLLNFFSKNPFFAGKFDILIFGSPRRIKLEDGKFYDIYTDYFYEEIKNKYKIIYLEPPYFIGNTHFKPARTEKIYYLDIIKTILAPITSKINRKKLVFSNDEVILLQNIENEIKSYFNISINLLSIVKHSIFVSIGEIFWFKKLLCKISPKVSFIVCSYGNENFIEACKDLNIKTVEIQHGTISPYHLGYNFPLENLKKRSFSDYIFLFGDFWKYCSKFPISKENIISIGFPFIERQKKIYNEKQRKNQIVFVSQGTVGKKLSLMAYELSKKITNYKIVYKLHPGEYSVWRQLYPYLEESDITVIDSNSVSIYSLFAESKIQIGVYSTAIFEGVYFGLYTFLIDINGIEHARILLDLNYATLVSDIDDLITNINSIQTKEITSGQKNQNVEYLFKSNSIENFKNEIEKILNSI